MDKATIEEAIRAAEDEKMRKKAEKAYNDASTTAPAPVVKKAKGGSVTRADGCITKGHTKGRMV